MNYSSTVATFTSALVILNITIVLIVICLTLLPKGLDGGNESFICVAEALAN